MPQGQKDKVNNLKVRTYIITNINLFKQRDAMKNVFTSNVFHNYLPRCKLGSKGNFFPFLWGNQDQRKPKKRVLKQLAAF